MASDRSVEPVPPNIAIDGNGSTRNGKYSDTYFTLGKKASGFEFNPLPNLDVDPRTKKVCTKSLVQQILVDKKIMFKESTKNGITVYKAMSNGQQVTLGFVNNGNNKVKMADVATIRKLAKEHVDRKAVISDVTADYVY